MNKRIMTVICIIIAALSFMGGMLYKYEDYVPLIEVDYEQAKYVFKYNMPLDKETAVYWFDWAIELHREILKEQQGIKSDKYHEDAIEMYKDMRARYLQFNDKW